MQRLHNIDKWTHVAAGGAMNFEDTRQRRIRLDVNAAGVACLFYADGDGNVTLLGRVQGRDVLEFATAGGTFSIQVEDADVWVYTIDGEDVSFSLPDAVTFTKLVERRERNPQLEMMQYLMNKNMRDMLDAQRGEMVKLLDQRERAAASRAVQPAPAGDDVGSGKKPATDEPPAGDVGDKPADAGNGAKAAK